MVRDLRIFHSVFPVAAGIGHTVWNSPLTDTATDGAADRLRLGRSILSLKVDTF